MWPRTGADHLELIPSKPKTRLRLSVQRRDFIKKLSLFSTASCVPGFLASNSGTAKSLNSDRILVIVELAGGCDGLNTLVPFTNDSYYSQRPALAIPADRVLPLSDEVGLHPAMLGFRKLFDEGQLAVIQGVGYPNPSRSHLRSRDIWHTGDLDPIGSDGWLAGYVSQNRSTTSSMGINAGGHLPRAFASVKGPLPSLQAHSSFRPSNGRLSPGEVDRRSDITPLEEGHPRSLSRYREYLIKKRLDTPLCSAHLLAGRKKHQSRVVYPETPLAQDLKVIAQIIGADLGFGLFYTSLEGFDTHASQVSATNSLEGAHASLLKTLSDAISAFEDDLQHLDRDKDTLIMTFSEFGRQLQQNASLGTDHGTANQMFLIGPALAPGIYGSYPGLSDHELNSTGDLTFTVDFRTVYSTVLSKWLGADPAPINDFYSEGLRFL